MKIAFFGTPDFAVPALDALCKGTAHEVVCVVTQPDRPSGRGGEISVSPVKRYALEHNIPVIQPESINKSLALLDDYAPDIIAVVAFGQILRQAVLDYCPYGALNVHASILPAYRGSSPIQWAIIKGERRTGVTVMQIDPGLDTGDILHRRFCDIGESETAGELFERLSKLGAEALVETLEKIENGTAKPIKQDNSQATAYPMLSKESGRIDWARPATEISCLVRGLNPWPIAYFVHEGQNIRVYNAAPIGASEELHMQFLTTYITHMGGVMHASAANGLFVRCGEGILRIDKLQMPGGKALSAKDFLNGRTFSVGTVFE